VPAGLIVAASVFALNAYAAHGGVGSGATLEAVRGASVITLSVLGLWIPAVVSHPLDAKRVAVLAAMCVSLVILLNLPLAQDFFSVAWPLTELLLVPLMAGAGGGLAGQDPCPAVSQLSAA
jgi:cation-transporting ATPase E